jgi:hypothetical protein
MYDDCFDFNFNDPKTLKRRIVVVLKISSYKRYMWLRRSKRNGKVMYVDLVGRQGIKRRAVASKKKPTLKNT